MPSITDSFLSDEQTYSLKMTFYNLINVKTPFLRLERDLKTTGRLSLEEDFSVKKNFQVFFK